MRSRARAGSHWRPFPRTRPRASRASGLGSEGRWDGVRERWRSQLHPHRARARARGGLRERGQWGRGGGVVSSLFLFPRPVQLWRASCGHPNHGAISQMVKINGRQPASAEYHMSSARNEIACEGAAWTGETFERERRRAVGLWSVVVLVSDLIFRVVRACVCVGSLRAVDSAGAFERATAARAATRAAPDAAPERASVAGTRARDARAGGGGGG